MNNPLVGGIPQMNQMNGPMANIQQTWRQYQQFKQSFKGNPQEQIQQLMNSGKVSQQAYNNAYQMATQFQKMMGGK